MKSDEQALKELVDRCIPTPSDREMESRCDRVLQNLQSGTIVASESTRLRPEPIPSRQTPWRVAVVCAAVAAAFVVALSPTIWKTPDGKVVNAVNAVKAVEAVKPAPQSAKGDSSTTKTLADGSRIEMRAGTEAVVEHAPDGLIVRLNTGSMMVFAAKQAAGRHLYVQTRDLKVSVVGTVFLVKTDDNGSRVAVIEGEVRVQQGSVEKSLRPGEQVASNSKSEDLAMFRETGWSREAAAYLAKLHESVAQTLVARQTSGRTASVSDKPRFEEASIRLCEEDFRPPEGARGGGNNSIRLSPGRVDVLCMTVTTLIRTAYRPLNNNSAFPGEPPAMHTLRMNSTYGLGTEDGTRVRGGPDWVRAERYAITAVGDSTDAGTLQGPMVLDLLERRFQLKLRVETEEASVYGLTIARGGLKIKPAEPGSCLPVTEAMWKREDPAEYNRLLEALRRGAASPWCGSASRLIGPNKMVVGGGVPIRSLVDMLSRDAGLGSLSDTLNGLLVVDKTGIPETNLFNYVVEYVADESQFTKILPPGWTPADLGLDMSIPKAPNVFDAVEKLGLHLEKSKASREFIVIERIERLSPN